MSSFILLEIFMLWLLLFLSSNHVSVHLPSPSSSLSILQRSVSSHFGGITITPVGKIAPSYDATSRVLILVARNMQTRPCTYTAQRKGIQAESWFRDPW